MYELLCQTTRTKTSGHMGGVGMLSRLSQRDKRTRLWLVLAALALLVGAGLTTTGTSAGVVISGAQASQAGDSAAQPSQKDGSKTAPFNCSQIKQLGIDKQMNFHASQLLAS